MSIEATLSSFLGPNRPLSLTVGPNASLYRGLSIPARETPRISNTESAWFCSREQDAIGYANFKVIPGARPYLMVVRTANVLELIRVELKQLTELPFQSGDGPRYGLVPSWQKEKLLPALLKLFPADGIFEGKPPREFWLTAQAYEIVETVPL